MNEDGGDSSRIALDDEEVEDVGIGCSNIIVVELGRVGRIEAGCGTEKERRYDAEEMSQAITMMMR